MECIRVGSRKTQDTSISSDAPIVGRLSHTMKKNYAASTVWKKVARCYLCVEYIDRKLVVFSRYRGFVC